MAEKKRKQLLNARHWLFRSTLGVHLFPTFIFISVLISLTSIDAYSAQVTLISPAGTVADNTPTYTWYAVPGTTRYHLVAKDSYGRKINQVYTTEQSGCESGDGICSVTPETGERKIAFSDFCMDSLRTKSVYFERS
jgi:hypothetical protein